ncbi:MAG: hypothetical protein QXU18_11770 [Thermoplasmatales archaeon]
MRKKVMLAGAILLLIGIAFMAMSSPLLSNYSGAGMHYSNNYFISDPIKLNSSDVLSVESSSTLYLVSQSSVSKITHTDISSLQVTPSTHTSIGGITTETWSLLNGTYFLVSFNSSSTSTRFSIITSSSQPKIFEYALVTFLGIILFFAGAFALFVGLILKKKIPPSLPEELINNNSQDSNNSTEGKINGSR